MLSISGETGSNPDCPITIEYAPLPPPRMGPPPRGPPLKLPPPPRGPPRKLPRFPPRKLPRPPPRFPPWGPGPPGLESLPAAAAGLSVWASLILMILDTRNRCKIEKNQRDFVESGKWLKQLAKVINFGPKIWPAKASQFSLKSRPA